MNGVTERCPWCESVISRAKFLEIEAKIREQEQKRLAEAEVQMRKRLEEKFQQDLAKQKQALEKSAQDLAAKQVATALAQRDQIAEKLKQADELRQKELTRQRQLLEKDRDQTLLKKQAEFNREREGYQKKMIEMERQLQRKTANEMGDGAEIDLLEELRAAFPGDKITRIQKGQAGADILHEVLYKGQSCGRIIIDSKNRQAWQNAFVTKLRQDQTEAAAEHAILATTVFPGGKKELCIESDVIVVNPARACHVISLVRRTMITVHVRGLSMKERAGKMGRLYKLITSEPYAQRFGELAKLTTDILDLDVQEKKTHDNVWKKRGSLATRMNHVLREIETEVAAITEAQDESELPAAS